MIVKHDDFDIRMDYMSSRVIGDVSKYMFRHRMLASHYYYIDAFIDRKGSIYRNDPLDIGRTFLIHVVDHSAKCYIKKRLTL